MTAKNINPNPENIKLITVEGKSISWYNKQIFNNKYV